MGGRASSITDIPSSPCPPGAVLGGGGRFNIGSDLDVDLFAPFPALYIASDYDTAYAECFGLADSDTTLALHELALRRSSSFSSVALNGELLALFDLRDVASIKGFAHIISSFRMNKELRQLARELGMKGPLLVTSARALHSDLLGNWQGMPSQYGLPANSQIFARFLKQAGFEGVIYPSTKGTGDCIALFLEQFEDSDSWIELADDSPPGAITRLDSSTARELY